MQPDQDEIELKHSAEFKFAKTWGPTPRETLEALKKQHGTVYVLKDDEVAVVFRKPTRIEYRECQAMIAGDTGQIPRANERLASEVVVYPEPQAFQRLLDEWAGVADKVASDARRVMAREEPQHAKKYETPQT